MKDCEDERVVPIAKAAEAARVGFVGKFGSGLERNVGRWEEEKVRRRERISDLERRIAKLLREKEEEEKEFLSLSQEQEKERTSLDLLCRLSEEPTSFDILDTKKYEELVGLALLKIPRVRERKEEEEKRGRGQETEKEREKEKGKEKEKEREREKEKEREKEREREREKEEEDGEGRKESHLVFDKEIESEKEREKEKEKEKEEGEGGGRKGSKIEKKKVKIEEERKKETGEKKEKEREGEKREGEKEGEKRERKKREKSTLSLYGEDSFYLWDLTHSLPSCSLSESGKVIASPPHPSNGGLFSSKELTSGVFSITLTHRPLFSLSHTNFLSHYISLPYLLSVSFSLAVSLTLPSHSLSSRASPHMVIHDTECLRPLFSLLRSGTAGSQCESMGVRG